MATNPQINHALDQIGGLLTETSPVLARFYQQLIANGCSEEMAIHLVRDMADRLLGEWQHLVEKP